MSRVAPLQEESIEEGLEPEELAFFSCIRPGTGRSVHGLGARADACPPPSLVLDKAHGGLVREVMIRQAAYQALAAPGRVISVSMNSKGEAELHVDPPVRSEELPAWANLPPSQSPWKGTGLLSWVKKMDCPSFSLPAGAPEIGGSCPGAAHGQTVNSPRVTSDVGRDKQHIARLTGLGKVGKTSLPVWYATSVCEYCLSGDTRVLVKGRGLMRLDELGEGRFTVWSGKAWRETQLMAQGVRDVVELQTSWGHKLTLTPDHKVLTEQGMVAVDDLDLGARLYSALPGQQAAFPEHAELPRFDLGEQHHNAVRTSYPTTWSSELGYTLGAILGDGAIHYRKYPTVSLGVAEEDREIVDRVSAAIRSWCATETDTTIYTPVGGSSDLVTATPQPQARASWRVKSLVGFFDSLGFEKRSEASAYRAPKAIWTASHDGVRGFLQGLFDTDGCVSVGEDKVEISLASVSEGLLRDVQLLLQAFGVRSTICPYKTSNRQRAVEGYSALFKLSINAIESTRTFLQSIGFQLARKQKNLAEAVLRFADRKPQKKYPKVVSITKVGALPVFDLVNVGEERQFLANGIIVSNCYAAQMQSYQYMTSMLGSVARMIWTIWAVRSGHFVPTMVEVVERADYKTPRATRGNDARFLAETGYKRFFRIHDSGDFFGPEYVKQWKQICDHFHPRKGQGTPTLFWAPVRVWALPAAQRWLTVNSDEDTNLVARPSGYHLNARAPSPGDLGGGYSAGSVVISDDAGDQLARAGYFNYVCPATIGGKAAQGKTCLSVIGPDDKPGCRACWAKRDLTVAYIVH